MKLLDLDKLTRYHQYINSRIYEPLKKELNKKLPLSGGTMNPDSSIDWNGNETILNKDTFRINYDGSFDGSTIITKDSIYVNTYAELDSGEGTSVGTKVTSDSISIEGMDFRKTTIDRDGISLWNGNSNKLLNSVGGTIAISDIISQVDSKVIEVDANQLYNLASSNPTQVLTAFGDGSYTFDDIKNKIGSCIFISKSASPKWGSIPLRTSTLGNNIFFEWNWQVGTGFYEHYYTVSITNTDGVLSATRDGFYGANVRQGDNISIFTNDANYQTEEQVNAKISSLVNSAPETLDTLNELAAALGDDPNFATTIATQIGNKQDTLVSGTNIKTLGGESILGSGNFEVASSSDIQALFN